MGDTEEEKQQPKSLSHYWKRFGWQCKEQYSNLSKVKRRTMLVGLMALALCLFVVRPYINGLGLPTEVVEGPEKLNVANANEVNEPKMVEETQAKPSLQSQICDETNGRSKTCELNGDIRIDGNSSTIYVVSLSSPAADQLPSGGEAWNITPYARKFDETALSHAKQLTIRSLPDQAEGPNCSLYHRAPAVVFSLGGYTGNYFHDYTDVLVPLFLTTHHLRGDVYLLIAHYGEWWVEKYRLIFNHLSHHDLVDLEHDSAGVRCFFDVTVGLTSHKELSIDPAKSAHDESMHDFAKFLRRTYSLKRDFAVTLGGGGAAAVKPRLMIISRKKSRAITNMEDVSAFAAGMGFEVIVPDMEGSTPVAKVAEIVNSCDVLMGVHGAGLTNLVFLPTHAVVIQILPFGRTDEMGKSDFGEPAVDMKLRYLSYKVGEKESSLSQQYPHDHPVLRDPDSIFKKGWKEFGSIYLDKQNVKLDLSRFKDTLSKAMELLHH